MGSRFESHFIDKHYDVNCASEAQGKSLNSRRRSRNPELWLKSKRKNAILSGQSYTNTRGKVVSSKKIGPNCNCRNKCFHEVDEESRKKIFNGFYNLKSYDEQNSYLYGLIRRHAVLRKRHPNSVKRTCSYKYYVRIQGREVQVCKRAFASIHSISDKKIRTLCIKHEKNVMFPRDNRGRHCNRPKKVSSDVVRLVKQHIVTVLSESSASEFIKADRHQAPDVNVTKLYRNFLSQHEPEALLPDSDKLNKDYDAKVKPWVYFKVFHEEFKSLDLQSIKRRLTEVRRSLGTNSTSDNTKSSLPCVTSAGVTPVINVPSIDRHNVSSDSRYHQAHQNSSPSNTYSVAPSTTCDLTTSSSASQPQVYYQQQPPLNLHMISTPNAPTTLSSGAVLTSSNISLPAQPYLLSLGPNLVPTASITCSPAQFYATNVVAPCAIFAAASPVGSVPPKQTSLASPSGTLVPSPVSSGPVKQASQTPSNGTFVGIATAPVGGVFHKQTSLASSSGALVASPVSSVPFKQTSLASNGPFVGAVSSLNTTINVSASRSAETSSHVAFGQSEPSAALTLPSEEVHMPPSDRASSRVVATALPVAVQQATQIIQAPAIPGSLNCTTTSLKILTPLNVTAIQEDNSSRDYNIHKIDSSGNITSHGSVTHLNVGCRPRGYSLPGNNQIYRSTTASTSADGSSNIITLQNVQLPHSLQASQSISVPPNLHAFATVNGVKTL